MDKRKPLFNDSNTYESFKKIELELFKIVDTLQEIADSSLGVDEINNWKEYLNAPADWLINKHWLLWGSNNNPPNADKTYIFENSTRITKNRIDGLKQEYETYFKKLRKHHPTVNAKGVVSGLKKESFNKYLRESKREHYKLLKDFLNAAEKLKDYGASQEVHLVRYAPGIQLNNAGCEINEWDFVE